MANIAINKENFTIVDGYFAYFDEANDTLFYKTDDGTTAFSYPLDTLLSNVIKTTEYDGVNFWTLEDPTTPSNTAIIKRWKIDNYICKLQDTITMSPSASHIYDSQAFTVEHYHTAVTGTEYLAGTQPWIGIPPEYAEKIVSGMSVTLGPNASGLSETINVFDASSVAFKPEDNLQYTYGYHPPGSPYLENTYSVVQFYKNIWLFNNYNGTDSSTGALYKISPYTGSYITKFPSGAYKSITGCTFYKVDSFTAYGEVDALCYVKASNMLFVDVTSPTLDYYGSMVLASNATVYDLTMYDQNVYKLLSGYNYGLETLNPLVTSIALTAAPAIITATGGYTKSVINAAVKDQFFQPIIGRTVSFTDDDTGGTPGYMESGSDSSDSLGIATDNYWSGSVARNVTITATVQQT